MILNTVDELLKITGLFAAAAEEIFFAKEEFVKRREQEFDAAMSVIRQVYMRLPITRENKPRDTGGE